MKLAFFISLAFFCNETIASSMSDYNSLDRLKKLDDVSCKGVKESDGYSGLAWCIDRVYVESDKRLKARVAEYKLILQKAGEKKYLISFESAQQAWEKYKAQQCTYETLTTQKDSDAYHYLSSLCGLTENYNRLSTLKTDPVMP